MLVESNQATSVMGGSSAADAGEVPGQQGHADTALYKRHEHGDVPTAGRRATGPPYLHQFSPLDAMQVIGVSVVPSLICLPIDIHVQ